MSRDQRRHASDATLDLEVKFITPNTLRAQLETAEDAI